MVSDKNSYHATDHKDEGSDQGTQRESTHAAYRVTTRTTICHAGSDSDKQTSSEGKSQIVVWVENSIAWVQ